MVGDAVFEAKDSAAVRDAGARAGVSTNVAESAGEAPQCQQQHELHQQQQAEQAAAPAAADPAPTQMELAEHDEQP